MDGPHTHPVLLHIRMSYACNTHCQLVCKVMHWLAAMHSNVHVYVHMGTDVLSVYTSTLLDHKGPVACQI